MFAKSLPKHKYGQISTIVATLAAMILLPYLVHLIAPTAGVPLGARLLPIFYAPLVAVILFDWKTAVAASLLAPILNHLITGNPAQAMVALLTIEVVVFSIVAAALVHTWPRFVFTGPVAYVTAVLVAALTLFFVPLLPVPAMAFFTSAITNAIPGLLILLAINMLLVLFTRERNVG